MTSTDPTAGMDRVRVPPRQARNSLASSAKAPTHLAMSLSLWASETSHW